MLNDIVLTSFFAILGALISPAFNNINSMNTDSPLEYRVIYQKALRKCPKITKQKKYKEHNSQQSDADFIIMLVVGAFATASLYLKYKLYIGLVVAVGAVLTGVVTAIALIVMSRRGVVAPKIISYPLLAIFLMVAIGLTVAAFIFNVDPTGKNSISSLNDVASLIYQLMGALIYLAASVSCIFYCVSLLCSIYIEVNAFGARLWKVLFRMTSAPKPVFLIVSSIILGILAIFFANGDIFKILLDLQQR